MKYQPPQPQSYSAETAALITRLKERIKRLEEALDKTTKIASKHIKRLEDAGDEMARWLSSSRNLGDDPFLSHKWRKAKEAKL